ncbi:MAG: prepilin-type N-terminal cleavage/methylation domain-containing protein [Bacilli bacterium]|nr:prepilin-type N-terminal cleavage/methylation domain-containing protein [Bacilli bacterium]
MKKRNGFTLVELLAVIVILAIILVIAIPQIMKTIDSARLGSFRSTVRLLLTQAEKQYLVNSTLGESTSTITGSACNDLAKLSATDYDVTNCNITFDSNGYATLKLSGQGKFANYSCGNTGAHISAASGTADNVDTVCVKSS